MNDQETTRLREALQTVVSRINRFKDRTLGEQNTKASLIEPVLEALGWDVRDPDEVHREFKPTSKDCPVDYALAVLREPCLFVEAKGLGEFLDRKWIGQVLGYATVAGVEWCILTDGDEYRFYNATAPVDAEEKLFFKIKLSESPADEVIRLLSLISRGNLTENALNVLWNSHFVDRRVKDCLLRMVANRDKALLRLIRKQNPRLQPKDILQSLTRLDLRIEQPTIRFDDVGQSRGVTKPKNERRGRKGAGRRAAETRKILSTVTLADLIAAAILMPSLRLFRNYKGHRLEATLLKDGKVEFQGEKFDSCSTAAEVARGTVTGRRMNTNGWTFWQYLDGNNKKVLLDAARRAMLRTKSSTH